MDEWRCFMGQKKSHSGQEIYDEEKLCYEILQVLYDSNKPVDGALHWVSETAIGSKLGGHHPLDITDCLAHLHDRELVVSQSQTTPPLSDKSRDYAITSQGVTFIEE